MRAPPRAAISTACAFSPPTPALSVIAPSACDTRDRGAHDGRTLGGRHVVRLEHEAGQPDLERSGARARGRRSAARRGRARRGRAGRPRRGRARARRAGGLSGRRRARSSSSCGTGGVPLMWNDATVCIPHACPFARSACVHTTGSGSGSKIEEAARAHLDPVAAGLVGVEEERLLDRVLVRARLHHDPVLEEDVGGAQHVLALVDEEGDVVQPAARSRRVARVGDVVGLLVRREPDPRLGAVVEHDLLGQPQPEVRLAEDAVRAGIEREEVDVVEVSHADAAPGIAVGLVLERRLPLGRRDVALGLVEELEPVAVGIAEACTQARDRGRRRATRPRPLRPRVPRPAAAAPRGCSSGTRGDRRPRSSTR